MRIAFVGMSLCSIVFILFREYKADKQGMQPKEVKIESDGIIWIGTVLCVFFVSLIVFSLRWKIPYTGGINYYEADFIYWIKDIVAIKKKVPPINFIYLTDDYRYHYFGAFQQAVVSSIMGIPAVKAATCYSYIEGAVFFGLSSYALMKRMVSNNIVKVITMILILFATGYEINAGVTYIWHIRLLPMSYDIAQSLAIVVILLLLIQLEKRKICINDTIIMLSCLICCTGTKSATGVVIFTVIFMVYAFSLLRVQKKKNALIYASAVIIIFGMIGLYLWPTARRYNLTIRIPIIQEYSLDGLIGFIYNVIDWFVTYIQYYMEINVWTFIPAVVFVIWSAIDKFIKKEHVVSFIIIMIGTTLGYIVNFYGSSQMYFAFIAYPFAAVLTSCLIEKIFEHNLSNLLQVLLAGIICSIVLVFSLHYDYNGYFSVYFSMGMKNFNVPDVQEIGDEILQISYAECQAYDWIRENTDEEVLLLSDRALENKHDPTAIFSERYVYFYKSQEEREIGAACFDGDEEMIEKCLNWGIDYIVQTKRLSPIFHCPENMGELVFDNEEVAVYKLF